MAIRELWFGEAGPILYDDSDVGRYDEYPTLETRAALLSQAYVTDPPIHDWEIVRKIDLSTAFGTSTHTAGENLAKSRFVRLDSNGKAWYADRTELDYANAVYGVTLNAASTGEDVEVRFVGVVYDDSWSWTPSAPLFLDEDGAIVQTEPTSGFVLVVGFAITSKSMMIGIKMPIILQ